MVGEGKGRLRNSRDVDSRFVVRRGVAVDFRVVESAAVLLDATGHAQFDENLVEDAVDEVDFTGEEAARGFLATAIEIGHGKVLLELVHNIENLNETIGPTSGAGPELESRKDSYYASSRQQDRKKRATAGAMCACRGSECY